MHDKYRYFTLSLCIAMPAAACDLPEKVVGETADPMADEPPQDEPPQDEPPQDEPPQDEPPQDEEPPQDVPPQVDPPSEDPTVVAQIAGTLAVDDTWLFIGDGNIPYRVVKSGGAVEPVVSAESVADTGRVELIALDDTHVYWNASGGPSFGYQLLRAPKTGGEPTLVTSEPGPNLAVPTGIAVDADYVYLTQPDIYNNPPNGVVRRVPKAGGAALDLAQAFTLSVAVSDSYVYYARLANNESDELVRADKDGGNPEVIASELGPILDVQVAGDRVFWNSSDAGAFIVRTALEGGATTTLYSETGTEYFAGAPAVTAGGLYWLRGGGADAGGVLSVDIAGEISELVTAPASSSYSGFGGTYGTRIAADDTAVYWAYEGLQGGAPRIYRVAR